MPSCFQQSPDPPSHKHTVSPLLRDIAKFITHFIVEEIDENTSMEDLQKMMAVALVYRVFVCVYEVNHILPCLGKGRRLGVVCVICNILDIEKSHFQPCRLRSLA